jgi:rhodanese-related sulfurtransferase
MTKKVYLPLALLLAFSMLLTACGGGAEAPVAEPVVEAPTEASAVVTEAPVAEVSVVEAPDFPALLAEFWASVPADKGYGSVGATKLSEELADKPPFLVDVREPAELEKDGYIEGAVNIPIRDLLQNLDKLPGLDEPIVIYCGSGHRGGFGLLALKTLGYTNVRNLNGGVGAWKKAELPLVTGSLPPAPEAISTPIVENEALFTALNDFLANLPEGFASIKADALATELADEAPFLVDVRSQAEWDKDGYIEGATLIEFPVFLDNLDKLPAEKDARIVIYCGSGHRGAMAEMALYLLGYTNVVNLNGGMGAWKAAGLPVAGVVDWATVMGEFVAGLPSDQGFYSTSATKLNEEIAADTVPFIVDVREPAEIESNGYIAGSVNIPIRDLLKNLDKLPAQDQKIVITCASGHRGAFGMAALRLLGYTNVVNLNGGVNGWVKGEFPVETELPAEAVAGTAPEVDAARFAALDAYLTNLPEAGFGSVKAPDFNTELAGGTVPFILDVRSQAEWDADGHIEGSVLVPITDLPANLDQLPADKAAPVVTTCKSGHRGAIAQMYLQFLGYTNVRNLNGGINAWIGAELPVVK